MTGDAADRLRHALAEKRKKMEAEADRMTAEAESEKERLEKLVQQMASVVGPVFSDAVRIFEENGFAASLRDELNPTETYYPHQMVLVIGTPDTPSAMQLSAYVLPLSGAVAFSVRERDKTGGVADQHVPISDLNTALVWSLVERLGERMP